MKALSELSSVSRFIIYLSYDTITTTPNFVSNLSQSLLSILPGRMVSNDEAK
jgi:hypothetical protein